MIILFLVIILTLFNILLLAITAQIITDFKRNQIAFIQQQNRNTVAILDIKSKLGEI